MEVLDGFFKVVVPLKNHFHGHKTRKVKTQLDFLLYKSTWSVGTLKLSIEGNFNGESLSSFFKMFKKFLYDPFMK